MKKTYPNKQILLKALGILIDSKKGASKFKVGLLGLTPKDQIEMLRLFPIFCSGAQRKSYILTAHDKDTINIFCSLSASPKLEPFTLLFEVLRLDKDISEMNLATLMTKFYFEFRAQISVNFYILLDKVFHCEFSYLSKNSDCLATFFEKRIEQLNQSQGPVPFMNLSETTSRIKEVLAKYWNIQGGNIHLTLTDLSHLIEGDSSSLYIPSFEALYYLQKNEEISISNITLNSIEIGKVMTGNDLLDLTQKYNYDRQKGTLQVRGYSPYSFKAQIKPLIDVLISEPTKNWSYSELSSVIDASSESSEKDKAYYDKFFTLNNRFLEVTKIKDFFLFDTHSVRINSKYTD